ncbi:MAG: hypothetical protein KIT80_23285 [Chitinophagaceae bacterium]|nr:hypothetical protein [Chitinophagaceae bacterium]
MAFHVRPTLSSTTNPKYLFSTNPVGDINSLNIFVSGGTNELSFQYRNFTLRFVAGAMAVDKDYIVFLSNTSGTIHISYSEIGSGSYSISSTGTPTSGFESNGSNWYIGARSDLNVDRFWRGHIGWLAFSNNNHFTTDELLQISSGAPVLSVLGRKLTRLWHWQTATVTEKDIIAGQTATRNGTGWADAEDRSVIYVYDPFTYPEILPQTILINGTPGDITVAGVSSQVGIGIEINGIPGSISLTGETANIIQAHHIDAAPGEITITGLSGNAIQSHLINTTPDQIAITGEQSHLSLAMIINAVAAGISIEALQAVIPEGVLISATPDGISVTGLQASVILGTTINATPAELSITGISSNVSQGIIIDASPDSVAVSGVSANVELSMLINATTADISITGEQASLSVGGEPIIINAITGSITINAVTGAVIYGSIALIPDDRIIAINRDNRIINITKDNRVIWVNERGGYVN